MDYQNIQTICPFCGCGCALNLEVIDGEIVGVLPANDHPVGRGSLCIKGWNAHAFVNHQDRLTSPLIRENGGFREASWDEALDLVAEKFEGKAFFAGNALVRCQGICRHEMFAGFLEMSQ